MANQLQLDIVKNKELKMVEFFALVIVALGATMCLIATLSVLDGE